MRDLSVPPHSGRKNPRRRIFGVLALPFALLIALELAIVQESKAADEKKAPPTPIRMFSGRLDSMDLSHHPMTLSASLGQGRPLFFLFEGALIPDTMVLSKGKTVGIKALKKGQLLAISYRNTPEGPKILKIVLSPRESPRNGKGSGEKSPKSASIPSSIVPNKSSPAKKGPGVK